MVRFRGDFFLCCLAGLLLTSGRVSAVESRTASKAGAKELVKKAMEAEMSGDRESRNKWLTEALTNKSESLAHSQMGLMRFQRSNWLSIDVAAAKLADSAAMKRYEALRSGLIDSVDGQWKLAQSCTNAKLTDQAQAHLHRVLQLDPEHVLARAALGFQKIDGEWISPERIAEDQKLVQSQAAAVEKHGRQIGEILPLLKSSQQWEQDRGRTRLFSMTDPSAALAAEKLISPQSDALATMTIEFLKRIKDPIATQSLLRHAMFHDSQAVRSRAAQELRSRDLHAYAPRLLSLLSMPIKSEVEAIIGPRGQVTGYRQVFERVGMEKTQVISTKTDLAPQKKATSDGQPVAVARLRVARNEQEADEIARASLSQTSVLNERQVATQNERIAARNARIFEVLRAATSADLPADPQAWWNWYESQIGIETEGRDYSVTEQRRREIEAQEARSRLVAFAPSAWSLADSDNRYLPPRRKECFVAGTLVTTHRGAVKIEEVRIGDMALSKDIDSGALAFRPVLQVTIRDPEALIAIQAGEELLRCTKGHLFWVSGRGWTKAGDLTEGMILHGAENPLRVNRLMPGGSEETFNLRVADNANYFVGNARILSHDVSSRGPSEMAIPGYKEPRDRK